MPWSRIARWLGLARKPAPDAAHDAFWAAMRDCEARIREIENSAQGIEAVFHALQLLKPKLDMEIEPEGDPLTSVQVRIPNRGSQEISYRDGLYEVFWAQFPETDLFRYESLENLVWDVTGVTIPRIYLRAYRWAERHAQLGIDPKTGKVFGVPINAISSEISKEFEKVDGVWRRKR